jgi:hypothetical protein
MNKILKRYCIFTAFTGTYGFSRGYRVDNNMSPRPMIGDRIKYGLVNGIYYMVFPYQINSILNLINRVYIDVNKLDKNSRNYIDNYEEIGGYCLDTL